MNRCMKLGLAALALLTVTPSFAEEIEPDREGAVGWTPIAFGIASPVQIPWGHADWNVYGLDFNVLYSAAAKMYGLGIGGLGMLTTDDAGGLEVSGLLNWNMKDFYGVRATLGANLCGGTVYGFEAGCFGYRNGLCGLDVEFLGSLQDDAVGMQIGGLANVTRGEFAGWSATLGVNIAQVAYGLQTAGIFNMTEELHGFQIGVVNYAQECCWGCQIGVVNIIMSNCVKVLPIINFYF